jgi:two-component system KDP operon response regulator KdpE
MLRRGARTPENAAAEIAFGDVRLDVANHAVTRAGEQVKLTPVEFRLLAHLAVHPGKVLTHRHLLREVWGPSHVEHGHYLRVYMGRLRAKLEDDPARPRHLTTETGVGYRFVP